MLVTTINANESTRRRRRQQRRRQHLFFFFSSFFSSHPLCKIRPYPHSHIRISSRRKKKKRIEEMKRKRERGGRESIYQLSSFSKRRSFFLFTIADESNEGAKTFSSSSYLFSTFITLHLSIFNFLFFPPFHLPSSSSSTGSAN